ncbi:2-hydroxyacid dehydrogenase [Azotobacter vinelandii]
MKIVMFSAQPYDERSFDEVLQRDYASRGFELVYQKAALSAQTVALAQGAKRCAPSSTTSSMPRCWKPCTAMACERSLLRCAGFNHIDLEAARSLGLFVARVPAYSPEAVAEHTIALILTLNRHTHRAYNRVREGNFMLDGLLGFNLHGKTVGLIGTGQIGLATARILKGFGCRVLGHDPYRTAEFAALGDYVELDVLLAESDVVSLHCPLSEATWHLIDAARLARIKRGAMLVNTSRGALIDTHAVIAALKSRRLSALAIDVYEQESQLFFHDRSSDIIDDDVFTRLMTFPNVIVTGHQGFFTAEALREIAETTLRNLDCYASGRACGNALAGDG